MSSIRIKLNQSDLKAVHSENSPAMKKLLGLESVKKALKHESSRQAFYETLKKNKDPRHMDKAIKKTLGEFLVNKNDKVTDKAVKEMGRELVKHGKRFIVPKKEMRSRSSHLPDMAEKRMIAMRPAVQPQNPTQKIAMINNHSLRTKMGGLSPSFGGPVRGGMQSGPRTPFRHP